MWDSLKKLSKGDEKVIIVEDGEPKYVLVPAAEYEKMTQGEGDNSGNHSKAEEDKESTVALTEVDPNEELASLTDNNEEDVVEVRLEDLDV